MNKVSVLMSIYNENESEIKKSINSILCQSYTNIELIIVIDNQNKIKEYCDLINNNFIDDRLYVVCNEKNIGLALSMNKAFSLSSGYYIARMDADDIAVYDRIEKEVKCLESEKYDFVCTGFEYIDENDQILDGSYIYYTPDELKKSLITTNCIHHPTVLMRRTIFEKVSGYRNFPCSQDYDLWLRMLEQECRFVMINEPLLKYRIRKNSITNRKKFLQAMTLYYISSLFYQRIIDGKDNYSLENYNLFIEKCENKYKNYKKNIKSIQLIQKKLGQNRFKNLFYRFILLFVSNFIRDSYLLKIKIKRCKLNFISK